MWVSFFLQAEDGIRDGHVTGVQTCALPISIARAESREGARAQVTVRARRAPTARVSAPAAHQAVRALSENGRASCREREEITAGTAFDRKSRKIVGYDPNTPKQAAGDGQSQ